MSAQARINILCDAYAASDDQQERQHIIEQIKALERMEADLMTTTVANAKRTSEIRAAMRMMEGRQVNPRMN